MSIDFRKCLYALSDVIINRPPPLRLFDQIYMKIPDMLLQAELIGRWFKDKRVVFVGDGDAIALSLIHLTGQGLLPDGPAHITVLDFDERVVNSIYQFASRHKYTEKIHGELYNVADALPRIHWQAHDAFYTNPPWGASNKGASVCAFAQRGIEACCGDALGCILIGDDPRRRWTHDVLVVTQQYMLARAFRVAEMLPAFHHYHLDDDPDLTSCAMVLERHTVERGTNEYASEPIAEAVLKNFYGTENPLKVKYVRDLTNGGKFQTRDIQVDPYNRERS